MQTASNSCSSSSRIVFVLFLGIYTSLVLLIGRKFIPLETTKTSSIGSSNTYSPISSSSRSVDTASDDRIYGGTTTPGSASRSKNDNVDNFPRMIITEPCSGSSITIQVAKKILEAHGYYVFAGKEPNVPRRNKFYDEAVENLRKKLSKEPTPSQIVAESFKIIHEKTKSWNKILLIKLSNIREDMLEPLKEMGAKYAFTYRDNVLDRAVCVTRDCFQKNNLGYQVFSNGTRSELCFDRRKSKEKIFAYMNNTDAMIHFMQNLKNENKQRMVDYKSFVTPAAMWSYEELFAFEYTDSREVFDQSVKMWSSFLKNFATINQTKVEEVLRLYWNTRPLPSPHSDVVYNIEDVKNALSDMPDLKHYLRE